MPAILVISSTAAFQMPDVLATSVTSASKAAILATLAAIFVTLVAISSSLVFHLPLLAVNVFHVESHSPL